MRWELGPWGQRSQSSGSNDSNTAKCDRNDSVLQTMTSLLIETVFLYVAVVRRSQTCDIFNVSYASGDKGLIKLYFVLQLKCSK